MRGLHTEVSKLRHKVFVEIAKIALYSENVKDDMEAIPYKISPGETPKFRESIYRERAVCAERARLAMGMSIRPQNKPVHITSGLDLSDVDEKYYEPPLMQVIPAACNACEDNVYEVSNLCRGCIAHPCMEVCPKNAISHVNGHAVIDKEKCIKCGKCKSECPYDAIGRRFRPCSQACGLKAIKSDENGRACIDENICVSCGMCMVSCPFGAIADKSQIFQLIRSLEAGHKIIVALAPAYVGQFGQHIAPEQIKQGLLDFGFEDVVGVALGADIGAISEAHDYVENVVTGKKPFLLTSCCPSWAMLAKKQFPEIIDTVSVELTPMVATARSIKQKYPDVKVVFVGPCAAKKLEASRRTVRSDVDFVITFEELSAMFEAKGIDLYECQSNGGLHDATAAGRGYAVAGGVSTAIKNCVDEYFPGTDMKIANVEGLAECKKMLVMAKAGRMNGYLIEGMGCPGGCVAGAGTLIPVKSAAKEVEKLVKGSSKKLPPKELREIQLP